VLLNVAPAHADLTSDLLAKSQANKTLHDKQRLATSGANFARSRTVTDGTCQFPNNWVGCQNSAEQGEVKFLSDDLALECEGVESGKICPAKAAGSFPSPFGL
jgi:photosystem I subunit PsaN